MGTIGPWGSHMPIRLCQAYANGGGMVSRERVETDKNSWGLCLELAHHDFYHILWVKASPKANPDSTIWWELLPSHMAEKQRYMVVSNCYLIQHGKKRGKKKILLLSSHRTQALISYLVLCVCLCICAFSADNLSCIYSLICKQLVFFCVCVRGE